MTIFKINSIYSAIEGEGVHIGTPQIFVRFQGCSVGCLNCDSCSTWDFNKGIKYDLSQIIKEIDSFSTEGKIKRVSITGGDPLHPNHISSVKELVAVLKSRGDFVNIEATGLNVLDSVFDLIDFISADFKTPSSGVSSSSENIVRMNKQYPDKFQIKSIIQNRKDFDYVLSTYESIRIKLGEMNFSWCLTPSFCEGESFPQSRFQEVQRWALESGAPFKVIGQQHKWIFGSDQALV